MKLKLLAGLLVAGAIPFVFSACKDDEVPKSGISFEIAEAETNESDNTLLSFHPDLYTGGKGHDITVKIKLDRPLAEAVVLNYSVSGTATPINETTPDPQDDYYVNDFSVKEGTSTIISSDKITIEKGATEATIKITVFEDVVVANDDDDEAEAETIVLTLGSVASGPAVLGENTTYTLTVNEDDSIVILTWMDADTEEVGDIDLDMFLWNGEQVFRSSASANPADPADAYEAIIMYGGFPEVDYGMSYTYYSGTSDNVNFYALMVGYFNGEFYKYLPGESDDVLVYGGVYHLDNVNKYDDTEVAPLIAQTLSKQDNNIEASEVTVHDTGSRSPSPLLTKRVISRKEFEAIQKIQIKDVLKKQLIRNPFLKQSASKK